MGCQLQNNNNSVKQNKLYYPIIIIILTITLTLSGLLFSSYIAKSNETIQPSLDSTLFLQNIIKNENKTTYTISNTTINNVYTKENINIITVDKNKTGDYTSIQQAINNAKDMSTIYIKPGNYKENIEIKKTIHLIGTENVIINPTSGKQNYAIQITAPGTKISKLSITSPTQGIYNTGIYICASNTSIIDCNIYNTPIGIAIWTSKNIIKNCNFQGCQDEAIALLGNKYKPCNQNKIINCIFQNNSDGIELQYSSNNIIANCKFYKNTHTAINAIAESNNKNIITNCTIYNNHVNGIYLSSSSNNQILYCNISKNQYGNIITTGNSYNNKITNINTYNLLIENLKITILDIISNIKIKKYIECLKNFNIPIYWAKIKNHRIKTTNH